MEKSDRGMEGERGGNGEGGEEMPKIINV